MSFIKKKIQKEKNSIRSYLSLKINSMCIYTSITYKVLLKFYVGKFMLHMIIIMRRKL